MSGARQPRSERAPACGAPNTPHALTRARFYPGGWLCPRHAPWAVAGRPEPRAGPGWPAHQPAHPPDLTV